VLPLSCPARLKYECCARLTASRWMGCTKDLCRRRARARQAALVCATEPWPAPMLRLQPPPTHPPTHPTHTHTLARCTPGVALSVVALMVVRSSAPLDDSS
jgi:hypothetical protein